MKKYLQKVTCGLVVCILLLALTVVPSNAAKRKVVKLKNLSFTTNKAAANKKSVKVGMGTYTVKMGTKGTGFVKFKAPKTKKYKFTFSKLKTNSSYTCGHIYVMGDSKYGKGYLDYKPVKTQGGSNTVMWIATRSDKSGHIKDRFLASRYAVTKLQKNQVVYIYFSIVNPKTTLQLNIK